MPRPPDLAAVVHGASRRLMALVTAGALMIAGFGVTATPARSDTTEDLLRLFLGIAAVAVVVNAFDDRRTPRHTGQWTLPDDCRETVRIHGRHVETYNARCLERAGYRSLPQQCRMAMRTDRGQRPSYLAQCLFDQGYRTERGQYYQPRPDYRPAPGYRPAPDYRPDRRPGRSAQLPRNCEMQYHQDGRRVDGYDGACLSRHGLSNLPRTCRVSDRAGNHYFNAQCLTSSGYRRGR